MTPNIADIIALRAKAIPDQPALLSDDFSISYQELFARADSCAERIADLLRTHRPLIVKHRVGLYCPNSAEYVIIALGILRAGACLVPLAAELTHAEHASQSAHTTLHLIISAGPKCWPETPMGSEQTHGVLWHWSVLDYQPSFSEQKFAILNPAFIRFSSGTTGDSKGVILGHQSLIERIISANRRLRISSKDRVLWTLPMAHHFAVSIVLYLFEGATVILQNSHLASELLQNASNHEASVMYGSPFHYSLLAADSSGMEWPSLRLAVSTATALRQEVAHAFLARFHVHLTQGLGVIEAGLPLVNTTAAHTKPLSVGKPDDFEVVIRDELGNKLTSGCVGELYLRGPGFFDAYLIPWKERSEVLLDGWLPTGDLAEQDEPGHVFIKGRRKSLINIGGMKFFPEEVETVLNQHPDVKSSRVFCVPHERWETIPVAEVVPQQLDAPPSPAALTRYCKASLANYKVPLRIEFVSQLPLTASGKIKR
jgi:long-chain acyl-CoA synthetase